MGAPEQWRPKPDEWDEDAYQKALTIVSDPNSQVAPEKREALKGAIEYYDKRDERLPGETFGEAHYGDPAPPEAPDAWNPDPTKWNDADLDKALTVIGDPNTTVAGYKRRALKAAADWYEQGRAAGEAWTPLYKPRKRAAPAPGEPPPASAPTDLSRPPVFAARSVDTIGPRAAPPSTWEAFLEGAADPFNAGAEMQGVGAAFADTDVGRAIATAPIAKTLKQAWGPLAAPAVQAVSDFIGLPDTQGDNTPYVDPKSGRVQPMAARGYEREQIDPRTEFEVARDRVHSMQNEARGVVDRPEDRPDWLQPYALPAFKPYPAGQFAAETAALAPTMATPLGAARNATMLGRAAQNAPVGAVAGGLSGFFGSDATLAEDPTQVWKDTALGTAGGAVAATLGGEAVHQGLSAVPQLGASIRGYGANREAARIEAAHGKDAARRMLDFADPASQEGAALRARVLAGEDPKVLAEHEVNLLEELTGIGPPKATRTAAARAADPKVRDEYASHIERELRAAGPTQAKLEQARRGNDPAQIDKYTRELTDHITAIQKNADKIEAHENITRKMGLARGYFQDDNLDPLTAMETSDALAADVKGRVQALLDNTVKGTEENRLLGRVMPYLEQYSQPIPNSSPGPYDQLASKWARLDGVKRDLQKMLKDAKFKSHETAALDNIENELRFNLERPDLWGPGASNLQIQRNRAWHGFLQLTQTRDGKPRDLLTSDIKGTPSANELNYKPIHEGGLREVGGLVDDAGNIRAEDELWKAREYATRKAGLGRALTEHRNPNPEMQGLAAEQAAHAGDFVRKLNTRVAEATAARDVGRLPKGLQDTNAGALQMLRSAETSLPDPDIQQLTAYLQSQGVPTENIAQIMRQHAGEQSAAREMARLPSAIRDPVAGAQGMLQRAGTTNLPDQELQTAADWLELTNQGKSLQGARDILGQRAEQVRAVESVNAPERNLPDPPIAERLMMRLANAGQGVPGVTGLANEAANAIRPQGRTLSQRGRIIGQLQQALDADPTNARARTALDRMMIKPTPATGIRGGAETFTAQNLGLAMGDIGNGPGRPIDKDVKGILKSNPEALGTYAPRLKAAADEGQLGTELYKLEGDPQWKKLKAELQRALRHDPNAFRPAGPTP